MNYQYILFDLDGTITESGPGIMNSVAHALKKLGAKEQPESILRKFVGPPLAQSFMKFCGIPKEQTDYAISLYREYYKRQGMFENRIYPGVEEMLDLLKKNGKKLAIATSKPEVFSVQILEHFHMADYFELICGATLDEKRVKKEEVIQYTLESLKIQPGDKKKVLMVGDREHDILGAKRNGLDSLGVLYGYGSRPELAGAGADYIVETAMEIPKLLLN